MSNILHKYFTSYPSEQNALDIFQNEWSSKFPPESGNLQAGSSPLFQDPKVIWAITEMGGVENKKVLELGPLEGGHTYILEKHGASSILAIEANSRAYLKCLITKEILDLKRSKFLCGNFLEYLRTTNEKFDLCLATGVLYHQINPVELIYLISKVSDRIYMWTHYYDYEPICRNKNNILQKFPSSSKSEYQGFEHTLYRYEYQTALNWQGFSGGTMEYSHWLSRDDILTCLKTFGFEKIRINFEQPDHQNGPCFSLACSKN
ncbi:MAG TPA: class I SAM-dependent methyltransferase [Candidatus Acidoferrales bacterium]|nr:class I SAM-dependent methyltransferase [Candidatus Acidoferrales bacterium]